jgi:hypothetical protein
MSSSSSPEESNRSAEIIADSSPDLSSSPAKIHRLRRSSGQANPTSGFPVSPCSGRPPSSSSSRAVAPAMAGRRRCLGAGRAGLCPADLASVAWHMGHGPSGHMPWVNLAWV